ncbi:MAG: ribosome assembly RNA-binding protein YhbY [Tissierellia bacterium]|nr:ribosome assembly RNA-binding protein YhbY [Tissierellia bacterium]
MLTGKQRAHLKSMANTMEPVFQIGKNGLTDNFLKQIEDYLEANELVKVKVLKNSLLDATDMAREIADAVGAEFVQSLGNKFVLYKESKNNKKIQLP